jgi:hypothetical protein
MYSNQVIIDMFRELIYWGSAECTFLLFGPSSETTGSQRNSRARSNAKQQNQSTAQTLFWLHPRMMRLWTSES